jgi:flagellar FliL protein
MAELPGAGGAKADQKSPKKPKISVGIVAAALVVCIALGAGGYFIMTRRAIAGAKKPSKPAAQLKRRAATPVAVLSLAPFLINLADPDHSTFLKIEIAMGLNQPLPKDSGDAKDYPLMPEVRDTILGVLTTWQSSQLLAPGGKAKLKEQLLSAVQQRIPQLGAVDIYFTDFLIQQ